ncbi:MAG: pantoate--beta-alanine ligase [candidate division WOR-3 bacterium]|uniref:Pantothenate synthetase n=1 Tax=candidate division WOR-3 bacterium TaxID=2052148 RepID=A0A7V3ZSU3_UNCW3
MKIIENPYEMQKISEEKRKEGKIIGFVPTMGALHEGHLELIREARKKSDFLVVSIFVNPIQFGPKEDYKEYPRDEKGDIEKCEKEGVDIIFMPDVEDMYEKNFSTYVEVKNLTKTLCGKYRPGHFKGVTTVVAKLFNIVKPHLAFFGWKDAQQLIVIKKMVKDLNFDIEIIGIETVREKDGLAMSSRNVYLNEKERKEASYLYKALLYGKELIEKGERDARKVKEEIKKFINRNAPKGKIQYVEIVDIENLKPLRKIKGEIMIALAVFFGKARLIDNIRIKVD